MPDRAFSLAQALVKEMHAVEMGMLDDAGSRDYQGEVRRDAVARVLAADAGITDGPTISRVVEFMPQVVPGEPVPVETYAELASLLRNNLHLG